jgi:hypothetical protein
MDARKARKANRLKQLEEAAKPTIRDEEVQVTPIDRRSFLSRIGSRSAALAGVVLLAGSCSKRADRCDSDSGTDVDPTDAPGQGRNDRCDTD